MCLFLLPSAEDTEDKGAMDVASEAGGPRLGTKAVAEKQVGLLPF